MFYNISCRNNLGVSCACSGDKCRWSQSYTEGSSYHGVYYYDYVYLGGDVSNPGITPDGDPKYISKYAVKFPFGCHDKETSIFYII